MSYRQSTLSIQKRQALLSGLVYSFKQNHSISVCSQELELQISTLQSMTGKCLRCIMLLTFFAGGILYARPSISSE